jgi:iron complex outermembrane receptor protein
LFITYRDGAPSFPGYFTQEPYFDVDNIQILRGPQGTVVGQNSTGGAVFVNTKDPVIGAFGGYAQASLGNYHDLGMQAAVNAPISDTSAARVALFTEHRNSFYDITGPFGSDYNFNKGDQHLYAGRLSLLFKPTDALTIVSKTDVDYLNMGAYPADVYTNRFENLPYGSSTPNPDHTDLFDLHLNAPQAARDKFFREILRAEYETSSGIRLRSVSAFAKGNIMYKADLDGTASDAPHPLGGGVRNWTFFDDVDERQISQEFNVISPDDQRFTWLAGAFGVWNHYDFKKPYKLGWNVCYPYDIGACKYLLQGTNNTRSLALFGEVGYKITPELKLEVGGRYTWSRTENDVDVLFYTLPVTDNESDTFKNFSYKVSLGWDINPNHFLYAFVATGFRPGGLNVPLPSIYGINAAPFDSEKVQSFEAGWKGQFANGKIRATVNGFYNNYKDFQVGIGYPQFPIAAVEVNVPDTTKIYGAEAEISAHLDRLSLSAGFNILHSELGEFYAVDPRTVSVVGCDPENGPESSTCIDLTGRRQTYAPNFTFNASASYEIPIGQSDTLTPTINYGHIGSQWATLFQRKDRGDLLEARKIVNAELAWNHGSWTVTAYGTNLTDQHYVAALNSNLDFAGAPRQYGIKVNKQF